MNMTGEQIIPAPRRAVWEALNDPEILRQCIPGCQSLDMESEDRMQAIVEIKIGPIGARFKGDVSLTDLQPAQGYTIVGQGSGGIAGSAKGQARVRLSDDGAGTL
ncbi:MAG: carbon monoxide dehydrogenase subunit G, partial [Caulobacteraceae bacterium]|nr:carbon monoxide dehydrogenase subunit G [Caulobacteraceae bacterium]